MECKVIINGNERAVSDENIRAFVLSECFEWLKGGRGRILFQQRYGQVDVIYNDGSDSADHDVYIGNVQPQYPLKGEQLKSQVYNIAAWLTIEHPDEVGVLREI